MSSLWWGLCLTGAAVAAATVYIIFGPEAWRGKVSQCPGLVNLGNTCFINAVIQALASLPAISQWLLLCHARYKNGKLIKSLYSIVQALNDENELDINPTELLDALIWHGWLIDYQQQDALEFYHALLNTIEEEMTGQTSSLSEVPQLVNISLEMNGSVRTRLGSIIAPPRLPPCPLRGLLTSTLVCCHCKQSLPTRYEFIDSFPLQPTSYSTNNSLQYSLRQYMSSEFVQDVECPSCSQQANTKIKRTFVKRLRIGRLPEILCFYIVRTIWLPDGSMTKNTTHLEFPYHLDVASYMAYTDHTISYQYKLCAVIEHLGGPSSGHYCTYRKHNHQWIYTSDTAVYPVNARDVLQCQAYMLFYQRTR